MASAAAVALWGALWEWVDEGASFWAVVEEWGSYTPRTGSTSSEKEHLISVRTAMRSGGGRIIAVVVVVVVARKKLLMMTYWDRESLMGGEVCGDTLGVSLTLGTGDPSRAVGTQPKQNVSSLGACIFPWLTIGASQRIYATEKEFKRFQSHEATYGNSASPMASFLVSISGKARTGINPEIFEGQYRMTQ